jgi:antitoxin component HigA of HigAB toxin-antitoxin module
MMVMSGSSARAGSTAESMHNRVKVEVMDISSIKSQRDYRKVLKEIEGLMMAKRKTPEGDRLDVLVMLVEAWERKHYPIFISDRVKRAQAPCE